MAISGGRPSLFAKPQPQFGLGAAANQFMTRQARMPYIANLPDYQNLVAQRSRFAGQLLRGQVPTDVVQQLQQRGAERGIAIGSPGSANATAAWLRALGLTSLGLQQEGSRQLSQSIADTPVPELWNPLSLYVPELLSRQELQAAEFGEKGSQRPINMIEYIGGPGAGQRAIF